MTYGLSFSNTNNELVIDSEYLKPWFVAKGELQVGTRTASVDGPYTMSIVDNTGYRRQYNKYIINWPTPLEGGGCNFLAMTLRPNGYYSTDSCWYANGYTSIFAYFPEGYTPTAADDLPEVYFFSVNPITMLGSNSHGLRLYNSSGEVTFDSEKIPFTAHSFSTYTVPNFNHSNISSAITNTNVTIPSSGKPAFIVPYYYKSERKQVGPLLTYEYYYRIAYKYNSNQTVTALPILDELFMEDAGLGSYTRLEGQDTQQILCIDASLYDYGGSAPNLNATYSLSTNVAEVTEGDSITITLTTTNVATGTQIPWQMTGGSYLDANDFMGGVLTGTFTITSNGTASITLQTKVADPNESQEEITFSLLNGFASINFKINNAAAVYSLASSATTVAEGNSFTVTLTTTNVAQGTTVPYEISCVNCTFDDNDWEYPAQMVGPFAFTVGAVNSSTQQATSTVTFYPKADNRTDGNKVFKLYLSTNNTINTQVTITDTSVCPTVGTVISSTCIANTTTLRTTKASGTYNTSTGLCNTYTEDTQNSVTCGAINYTITPSVTTATEGNTITWSITTTNIANGTVINYRNIGTTTYLDFTDQLNAGTVTIQNNQGTITKTIVSNDQYEGTETIIMCLVSSANPETYTILKQSETVNVTDGPITIDITARPLNSSYSIISWIEDNKIQEGNILQFLIQHRNVPAGITGWWSVTGTATSADFASNATYGSYVTDANGLNSVSLVLNVDATSGTNKSVTFNIHDTTPNAAGQVLISSGPYYIIDSPPTYSIAGTPTNINEGQAATFTVTTTNVPNNTQLYVDLDTTVQEYGMQSVNVSELTATPIGTIQNNQVSFTVTPVEDNSIGEATELLRVKVFTDSAKTNVVATSNIVYVSDTSYIPPWKIEGPSSLDEGSTGTYSVICTSCGATTSDQVNLVLAYENAVSSQPNYRGNDISINPSGNTNLVDYGNGVLKANFSVTAIADFQFEGSETFKLETYLNNGLIWKAQTQNITINDTSQYPIYTTPQVNSFSWTPQSPDETVNRIITFTTNITDNTVSGAPRTFYWAVEGIGTTDANDFEGTIYGSLQTVNGAVDRTFTVTIATDNTTDTTQFRVNFYMQGAYTGTPFYQSSQINVSDTSKTPNPPVINYFEIRRASNYPYTDFISGVNYQGITPQFRWNTSGGAADYTLSLNSGSSRSVNYYEDGYSWGSVVNSSGQNQFTLTATNSAGSASETVYLEICAQPGSSLGYSCSDKDRVESFADGYCGISSTQVVNTNWPDCCASYASANPYTGNTRCLGSQYQVEINNSNCTTSWQNATGSCCSGYGLYQTYCVGSTKWEKYHDGECGYIDYNRGTDYTTCCGSSGLTSINGYCVPGYPPNSAGCNRRCNGSMVQEERYNQYCGTDWVNIGTSYGACCTSSNYPDYYGCSGNNYVRFGHAGNCTYEVKEVIQYNAWQYGCCPGSGTYLGNGCDGNHLRSILADGYCGQTWGGYEAYNYSGCCPGYGTEIGSYCDGYTRYPVRANGSCGDYIDWGSPQYNSSECGYGQPRLDCGIDPYAFNGWDGAWLWWEAHWLSGNACVEQYSPCSPSYENYGCIFPSSYGTQVYGGGPQPNGCLGSYTVVVNVSGYSCTINAYKYQTSSTPP